MNDDELPNPGSRELRLTGHQKCVESPQSLVVNFAKFELQIEVRV